MNDQGHLVTRVYGLNVNPERAGLVRKVLGISTAMGKKLGKVSMTRILFL